MDVHDAAVGIGIGVVGVYAVGILAVVGHRGFPMVAVVDAVRRVPVGTDLRLDGRRVVGPRVEHERGPEQDGDGDRQRESELAALGTLVCATSTRRARDLLRRRCLTHGGVTVPGSGPVQATPAPILASLGPSERAEQLGVRGGYGCGRHPGFDEAAP